jgi:hypothetical protein
MKMTGCKCFLGLFLCLLWQHIIAQNTIYRSNYFSLGNSYPYVFLDSVEMDTVLISGSNVIWDFSSAVQTQFDTLHAIDPANTIFYNDPNVNYNISDLCLYEPGQPFSYNSNMYSYYISDNSAVYFIGNWANNGIWESWYYHLTDTEKCFAFPFSLNDNFQDSFAGSSYDMSGSGIHAYQGMINVMSDGFGTLIFSNITYSNCLRVKSIRSLSDSSMLGVHTFSYITDTWFQTVTNGPVLEIVRGGNYISQTRYYYNNPPVSIHELTNEKTTIVIPNPLTFFTTIKLNFDLKNGTLIICDVLGNEIKKISFYGSEVKIDRENLTAGVYFYKIISDRKSIATGKIIIQ